MMSSSLKIMLVLPFLLIFASFGGAKMVGFESYLTEDEVELLNFEVEDKISLGMNSNNESVKSDKNIKSPIKLVKKRDSNIDVDSIDPPLVSLMKKKKGSAYHLSVIIISEKRKVAIINDRLVNENDLIGNALIVRIDRKRVLLKKNKSTWWEYLKEKK